MECMTDLGGAKCRPGYGISGFHLWINFESTRDLFKFSNYPLENNAFKKYFPSIQMQPFVINLSFGPTSLLNLGHTKEN